MKRNENHRIRMSSSGSAKAGLLVFCLVVIIIGIVAHLASGRKPQTVRRVEAAPVVVATVVQKDVPIELRVIGKVEPYAKVEVKARVNGELRSVHFREGQEVRAGDLLFTIDPRPFEVALQEAQARLARDVALAEKAEKDRQRHEGLVKGDYISREQFEQVRANADAMKASVEADKALVESMRLQLSYCTIHSPITGRVGSLQINQGSMIKANDDKQGIVNIVQIMPLYVDFSVPEQHLSDIKKYMARGPLRVEASAPEDQGPPEVGELTFMDNEVNRQTGTIRLRGTFSNKAKRLWPGQFVKVVLTVTSRPRAAVIPYPAIQKGQSGEFVFVVKPDKTVEVRPVSVGITLNDEALIEKGLSPGEVVVTDGQIRLFQGARVEIKENASGEGKRRS
ncbi:MAG: efflux RND transporter periplasmic adaptor subunit [Pseudomonadota bacterium]